MIAAPPQIPNYAQGFARHRGESACPEFWDGLVGLWAPFLGPTGWTLRNRSPLGASQDAGLSGIDPGLRWVQSRWGWMIDYDGADDYAEIAPDSDLPSGSSDRTVMGWFEADVVTGGKKVFSYGNWAIGEAFDITLHNSVLQVIGHTYNYVGSIALQTGRLYHFAAVIQGNRVRSYIDGVPDIDAAHSLDTVLAGSYRIGRGIAGRTATKFDGRIGQISIHRRALSQQGILAAVADLFAPLRPRGRIRGILPAVQGPWLAVAAETFCSGAEAGQTFHTGPTAGQIDGRCG